MDINVGTYECNACHYKTGNRKDIRQHLRTVHGFKHTRDMLGNASGTLFDKGRTIKRYDLSGNEIMKPKKEGD